MTTTTTQPVLLTDGRTVQVPDNLLNPDSETQFFGVIRNDYGTDLLVARMVFPNGHEMVYALSPCCNASDKGTEDGVVCRACYAEFPDGYIADFMRASITERVPA